jgi:hypothetical protein
MIYSLTGISPIFFFGIHKDFSCSYPIYLEYPLGFRSIPMVAILLGVYMRWIDPNGHYSFSNLNIEKILIKFLFLYETQVMIYIYIYA